MRRGTNIRVALVSSGERQRFAEKIRDLEGLASYPYGSDSFRIDHGSDYFKFFDRLGDLSYYVATDGDRLAAVGAAVLRSVPYGRKNQMSRAWYLCDLKVHPDYRGQNLSLLLFRKAAIRCLLRSRQVYAVTMNGSEPNHVAALFKRAHLAALSTHGILNIYSLSSDEVVAHRELMEAYRGPISFLCLNGVKDLIMTSSGQLMPIAHIQFGPLGVKGDPDPTAGFRHLIAAPAGDALANAFAGAGVSADATATILHCRMQKADFRFLLTSDI